MSAVGRESKAHPAFCIYFQLVPKLHLGTKMSAKLSLAVIMGVPKHSLGTRKKSFSKYPVAGLDPTTYPEKVNLI